MHAMRVYYLFVDTELILVCSCTADQDIWMGLFISIKRENLVNRHEALPISVNLCPIHAAFGIFLTNS